MKKSGCIPNVTIDPVIESPSESCTLNVIDWLLTDSCTLPPTRSKTELGDVVTVHGNATPLSNPLPVMLPEASVTVDWIDTESDHAVAGTKVDDRNGGSGQSQGSP